MTTLHPQLADLARQTRDAAAHARRLAATSDAETFAQRPDESSWSAGECVAHLTLTARAYLPLIDEALREPGLVRVPDGHRYRRDFMGWLLCRMMEPPARIRTATIPLFEPAIVRDRDAVVEEFVAQQDAIEARIRAGAGLDIGRLTITSPFNARLRYSLYSALCAVLAHQRRHLWQADRAIARVTAR